MVKVAWKPGPDPHDYPAAAAYLSQLLLDQARKTLSPVPLVIEVPTSISTRAAKPASPLARRTRGATSPDG
jgi:hypothetical protein